MREKGKLPQGEEGESNKRIRETKAGGDRPPIANRWKRNWAAIDWAEWRKRDDRAEGDAPDN